jgi:hypothetical protein
MERSRRINSQPDLNVSWIAAGVPPPTSLPDLGALSELSLGGKTRIWVPHPSSAWVGKHESGCPIQAPLGWENTKLGAPSKLRLGGKA